MKECKENKSAFKTSGFKLNLILILFYVGGMMPNVNAQGIEFMYDLDAAIAKAKVEDKLVFVDFYTSWCGPCKVLDQTVFPVEKVGDFFNANFISCKVQCDDEGVGVELGKKYNVNAYPTLMFLNENGEMVHSEAGAPSVDGLIEIAKTALDPDQNLMSIINKWNEGNRDKEFVLTYFTELKERYRNDKAIADFNSYFNGLNKEEKTSQFTFDLASLLKIAPFTSTFNYLEANAEGYYNTVDKKEFDDFIAKTYLWYIKAIINSGTLAAYEDAMSQFKAKKYPYYDEYAMFYSAFLAKKADGDYDIEEYMRRGTVFLDKYGKNNDMYTVSLTSLLGNLTGRLNQSVAGIQWMENLIARNPDPKYFQTYFYILTRNFQFEKALKLANEVRSATVAKSESTETIDKRIKDILASQEWYAKRNEK